VIYELSKNVLTHQCGTRKRFVIGKREAVCGASCQGFSAQTIESSEWHSIRWSRVGTSWTISSCDHHWTACKPTAEDRSCGSGVKWTIRRSFSFTDNPKRFESNGGALAYVTTRLNVKFPMGADHGFRFHVNCLLRYSRISHIAPRVYFDLSAYTRAYFGHLGLRIESRALSVCPNETTLFRKSYSNL
jgi:hypothetical protein